MDTSHKTQAKDLMKLYIITLAVLVSLDGLWLGVIAKKFYKKHMDSNMSFKLGPALLFYLLYPAAIVYFTKRDPGRDLSKIALNGALLGLTAYGTYDLTNLATVKNWSLKMSAVDMVWGAVVTSLAATIGNMIVKKN